MFDKSRIRYVIGIVLLSLTLAGCTGGSSGPSPSVKPTYRVDGVVDGATYDGPVTPKIALGPGTSLVSLTLNDENFLSDTQVSMAGEYTLTVIVENSQGERAFGSINFTIKAPKEPKEPDPEGVIKVPAQ